MTIPVSIYPTPGGTLHRYMAQWLSLAVVNLFPAFELFNPEKSGRIITVEFVYLWVDINEFTIFRRGITSEILNTFCSAVPDANGAVGEHLQLSGNNVNTITDNSVVSQRYNTDTARAVPTFNIYGRHVMPGAVFAMSPIIVGKDLEEGESFQIWCQNTNRRMAATAFFHERLK